MARTERPLDSGDSPLLRLAADLRKLRENAGNPTYRELSRRANYSIGALSDAAGGRRLPSLPVTMAYVQACGGDAAEWTQRWNDVAGQHPATVEDSLAADEGAAPYVGLAAFQSEDADKFFGREKLTAEVCALVAERRFVVVTGPSGSGKSSVLRAGLLHQARPGGGLTAVLTPGAHPLDECAAHLAALTNGSASVMRTALRDDPECLHLTALQALVDRPAQWDLLVVVDQFEEVFTLCDDPGERAQFLDVLFAAAKAPNSRTRVVLGVRADFYGHCTQYPDLADALRDAQVLVGPMTADELRSAITQPASEAGCRVETALVSRVIADATGQPGVLPLVSHALRETWRRRRGNILTIEGYDAAGGITEAITRTAEAIYTELPPPQQQWVRHLFLRLVALGDGVEDTRRRLHRMELDLDHPDAGNVLERLAQARLVTLDHDDVQIAHEALIRCWPRLRQWLSQDRDKLRRHRQLTDAATIWQSVDRDSGALYRGTRLDLARDLGEGDTALTPREREFLTASLAAEAAEHTAGNRRVRRRRQLIALLSVLLVLSTGTTIYAVRASNMLADQRNVALSEKTAGEAVELRATNPALAAQLGLAAYRLAPTPHARDGLLSTLATPLAGHTQAVSSVAFSPDGRTLATGSFDHTTRLWNITNTRRPTELATIAGHADTVGTLAFSPDGHILATASRDRTVQLWDITDTQHPRKLAALTGHTDTIYSVAFSPDGRTLATGSYDKTARLWNISNPLAATASSVLTGYPLSVKPVTFSPDGQTLATGSDDHTVRLWNIKDTQHPTQTAVITGHPDIIAALAFSPDGRTLASGSDDHTVRLWNITATQPPGEAAVLLGHSDVVSSLAFSPDGRTLASGSYDQTARIWNVSDPQHPTAVATLTGHEGDVNSVAFSPDGRTLATGSDDHTAQLWDTDTHRVEARACDIAHPTITRAEWDQYFPGLSYQPPC